MRAFTSAALAALALAGSQAAHADPTGEDLTKGAEACIRDGAPRVVAQSQGLSDAVSFLIDDLCAPVIRHAEAYERNAKLVSVIASSLGKSPATPTGAATAPAAPQAVGALNPESGDIMVPPGLKPNMSVPMMLANWFGGNLGATDTHAKFRSIAAQAVLAAREASVRR